MNRYQITEQDFQDLLKYLLEKKIVSEVLSGVEKRKRYVITPEFVSDPQEISKFPLQQLMVYNYGRSDSASNAILQTKKALDTSVAVLGFACDVRALVELDKKLQLKWENLFLITIENSGYIEVKRMMKFLKAAGIADTEIVGERLTSKKLILKMEGGKINEFPLGDEIDTEENTRRDPDKTHPMSDFHIGIYGLARDSADYILTATSERAKELIKILSWENKLIPEKLNSDYEAEAGNIVEEARKKRETDLAAYAADPNKLDYLAKCTGCGLCVKSCPVCYCVTCNLLDQVKAKTMDKLTFVSTRFCHIGDTCVECGRCAANCPVNIPLTLVFQSIRDRLQERNEYAAGKNLETKPLHLDV